MSTFEQQIRAYLRETLGIPVRILAWDGAARLAAFLTARYRFALVQMMDGELLLVMDEAGEPTSPAVIRKHIEQVGTKWPGPIAYAREQVTAYNRKRLIEQRVSFIVPGNQMYLPEFGLDLREYFRAPPPPRDVLRPATQAVLLYVLLSKEKIEQTATALAPLLGYSTMTLSRAFDELESAELAKTDVRGRERVLRLATDPATTWERAQPRLIDPVRSRHYLPAEGTKPDGLRAGHDALARHTMLAEPRVPVIAIGHAQWLSFREGCPDVELEHREDAGFEIEVWRYEPRAHVHPGVVEPLSLYLSVRQTGDERVEQALEELMEQVRW
jgi:hypothetical protein